MFSSVLEADKPGKRKRGQNGEEKKGAKRERRKEGETEEEKKRKEKSQAGEDPGSKGSSGAHSRVLPLEMGNAFLFPFQSENCCAAEISFSSVSEQHPKAIIPFPKERNSRKV